MSQIYAVSLVLERLQDAAVLIERPSRRLLAWNAPAAMLWGHADPAAVPGGLDGLLGANAALVDGPRARLAAAVRRGDGAMIELEASLSAIDEAGETLLLIAREATAHGRLVRQLQETQRVGQIGSWEMTLSDWDFRCTDEFFALFGLKRGPGGMEALLEAVHPDDREPTMATMREAAGRLGEFSLLHRVIFPGGRERVVLCRADVQPDDQGRPARMVGTAQDVTERVMAERALQRQYEELQAIDRMKTRFISVVSHELRTPLVSILGYAEFLEDGIGGELAEPQRDYVAAIQANSRRLQSLVEDLLDVAQQQSGRFKVAPRETDLHAVIRRAIVELQPRLTEAGIRLAPPDGAAPLMLLADPDRLEQVLTNVVGNAIKFSPAGGTIGLAVRPEAGGAWVEVTDDGAGIPPEALGRIFEPFYQVDDSLTRRTGGSGLGLSIARAILQAMGGTIEAHNRPEGGALFRLWLPGAEPPLTGP